MNCSNENFLMTEKFIHSQPRNTEFFRIGHEKKEPWNVILVDLKTWHDQYELTFAVYFYCSSLKQHMKTWKNKMIPLPPTPTKSMGKVHFSWIGQLGERRYSFFGNTHPSKTNKKSYLISSLDCLANISKFRCWFIGLTLLSHNPDAMIIISWIILTFLT